MGCYPARGVEEVDGCGLALGSDGDECLVGGDGDAGGLEVELDLGLELCGLDEQQRVLQRPRGGSEWREPRGEGAVCCSFGRGALSGGRRALGCK